MQSGVLGSCWHGCWPCEVLGAEPSNMHGQRRKRIFGDRPLVGQLGQKVNPRVAHMRTLREGIDQRSACRHPDWTGPDDLVIKIKELREITDWEKPLRQDGRDPRLQRRQTCGTLPERM